MVNRLFQIHLSDLEAWNYSLIWSKSQDFACVQVFFTDNARIEAAFFTSGIFRKHSSLFHIILNTDLKSVNGRGTCSVIKAGPSKERDTVQRARDIEDVCTQWSKDKHGHLRRGRVRVGGGKVGPMRQNRDGSDSRSRLVPTAVSLNHKCPHI